MDLTPLCDDIGSLKLHSRYSFAGFDRHDEML